MTRQSVILCDFDGTIIENDCIDTLLDKFGPVDWTDTGEKYLSGEITHLQMNKEFAKFMNATESEIRETLLEKIKIRTGFQRFYKAAKKAGIPLAVVSSGWDLYIATILHFLDFTFIKNLESLTVNLSNSERVPLVSNKVTSSQEKIWEIELPWAENSCQLSSPCKSIFVDHLQKENCEVICIGNSETDICMAEKADHVFATGSLPQHLEKKNIAYHQFDTFDQLIPKLNQFIK